MDVIGIQDPEPLKSQSEEDFDVDDDDPPITARALGPYAACGFIEGFRVWDRFGVLGFGVGFPETPISLN